MWKPSEWKYWSPDIRPVLIEPHISYEQNLPPVDEPRERAVDWDEDHDDDDDDDDGDDGEEDEFEPLHFV